MRKMNKKQQYDAPEAQMKPLGRATKQTKGFWGAYREEAGSVGRFGQIP